MKSEREKMREDIKGRIEKVKGKAMRSSLVRAQKYRQLQSTIAREIEKSEKQ